jgi:hypothetical protein
MTPQAPTDGPATALAADDESPALRRSGRTLRILMAGDEFLIALDLAVVSVTADSERAAASPTAALGGAVLAVNPSGANQVAACFARTARA